MDHPAPPPGSSTATEATAAPPRQYRRNHYRLLHVQPEAPLEVIKASYRTLMTRMRMHPDLGGTHEEAALINEAYAVLSDPDRRAEYDRQLRLRSRPDTMRQMATHAAREASGRGGFTGGLHPHHHAGNGARPTAAPAPRSAAHASALHRYAETQQAGHPAAAPMGATMRCTCAFCSASNPISAAEAPMCLRCGAPLTPVRSSSTPHFRGPGLNRRSAARRGRQHETVAYWGLPPQRHLVRWRDLSATGISVWSPSALAPSQRLHLIDQDIQAVAEVVACEAAPQGWLVRARLLTLKPVRRSGVFYSSQA